MVENLLIVFVKHPQAGKVKTRLAREVGDQAALTVYRELLSRTRKATFGVSEVERRIYFDRPPASDSLWNSPHFRGYVQEGKDLGQRMHHATEQGFKDGFKRVVIIGSDCPSINAGLLSEAFRILRQKDAALGPANDGGYYLLGLTRPLPPLFRHKEWSTETVLHHSIRDLQQNGFAYQLLDEQIDIDSLEDLKQAGPEWQALCEMPMS